jgi:hypothetical protein
MSVVANHFPPFFSPLQGPLVGNKTPSSAITEEYAKADPVYVQKTLVRTSFSAPSHSPHPDRIPNS